MAESAETGGRVAVSTISTPRQDGRRLSTRLVTVLAAVFIALLGGASGAMAQQSESVRGTLRVPGGDPVQGVTITVAQAGTEIGTATTDAQGAWEVPLPGPGTYDISLDVSTLPSEVQMAREDGEQLTVTVRPGQARGIIFALAPAGAAPQPPDDGDEGTTPTPAPPVGTTPTGPSFFDRAAQLVVEGIKFGSIIAITAVGLSLIFGTTGLINFAHGELVTLGAVLAFFFHVSGAGPGFSLILAALFAIVITALLSGGIEASLWRPLRKRGTGLIQMFIVSIGLSLLLRHLILVFYGGNPRSYLDYNIQQALKFGPLSITPRDLVVVILSVIVLLGVAFMLQRTRVGRAMRAVSDNRDLAESSGINVDRVVLLVWVLGGGLAALGGVFYGVTQVISWDMGFRLLLLMFAAIILGGLGSAYGAIVGGLAIGLVAQLSTLWFPVELQNAWALAVMILVLLFRPQGILGRRERIG